MVSGDLQEYRSSTGLPGSRSCIGIHSCTNSTGSRDAVVVQVGVVHVYNGNRISTEVLGYRCSTVVRQG